MRFCLWLLLLATACTTTPKIRTPGGIAESGYLTINHSRQYVLIRGKNVHNPVLLFLHGGPGASATALLRTYNEQLEDHFTVVYWDQRNAGKSFSARTPKEEIRVQHYVADVDTLVAYLQRRFHVPQLFLVGHSWGSRLGLYAIQRHPENFMAYVGVGQELASYQGELLSYHYSLAKARQTRNRKAQQELEKIGPPQSGHYPTMYRNGFWGLVRQKEWLLKLGGERYGRSNYLDWIMAIWLSREYSLADLLRYGKASGFSAGNIIYDPAFNNLDFFQQIPQVETPVYFISGAADYNTPWELVERYAAILRAPHKEFIKFERSGHSPVFEEPERFNAELLRIYQQVK